MRRAGCCVRLAAGLGGQAPRVQDVLSLRAKIRSEGLVTEHGLIVISTVPASTSHKITPLDHACGLRGLIPLYDLFSFGNLCSSHRRRVEFLASRRLWRITHGAQRPPSLVNTHTARELD